jgi:hypothetical protein
MFFFEKKGIIRETTNRHQDDITLHALYNRKERERERRRMYNSKEELKTIK